MRRLGWSSVLLLMAMLVACAAPSTGVVHEFRAILTADGASQAHGVSAAALYGEHLVVVGTFRDLGSVATRAAILDGAGEVFPLPVDRELSGRFSDFFEVTAQEAQDLREGRYHIRIYTVERPAGELQGDLAFTRVRRAGEDVSSLWQSLQE